MKTIAIAIAVVLPSLAAAQSQFVDQDFGSGLWPSDWTAETGANVVGWDFATALGRGNFTTGVGGAAMADSTTGAGSFDVSLISPSFYTVGRQWVEFDHQFSTGGLALASADLSIDGGDWVSMTSWTSTQGATPGDPSMDADLGAPYRRNISGMTPDTPGSARVRLRYSGSGPDGWWQVDQFRVIPEPSALALLSPLLGLGHRRRR